MSLDLIAQIETTVAALKVDASAFFGKGNKAAGTRTRKAAQELKTLAQAVRVAVSEAKNTAE